MPRKPKQTDGRESNEAFVSRLMSDLRSGPIAQLFIIEAVRRYAEQCAPAEPAKLATPIISGHVWKRCAVEIQFEVIKHLGE